MKVVLLYGALHPRKGIQLLLNGAASSSCPENIHILLAGRQSAEVRNLANNSHAVRLKVKGRLHIIDGYVDDQLERLILSASDFMWIGYSHFYRMSGILVLAARHGLPSIYTREGLIGHMGRQFQLGTEIYPDQVDTVVAALARLDADPHQHDAQIAAASKHFELHSVAHFQAVLGQQILNASPPHCSLPLDTGAHNC